MIVPKASWRKEQVPQAAVPRQPVQGRKMVADVVITVQQLEATKYYQKSGSFIQDKRPQLNGLRQRPFHCVAILTMTRPESNVLAKPVLF